MAKIPIPEELMAYLDEAENLHQHKDKDPIKFFHNMALFRYYLRGMKIGVSLIEKDNKNELLEGIKSLEDTLDKIIEEV